ncbi:MAG: fused MFS/spermidine synthase [Armatimonadota bacterium]|nr:fused MFS/spermidine synthase [Armatimonadota bacterium]
MRFLFIVTIFLGSALLFLAQPMAAKMILPRFGGSSAVWTTSVLFFQLLLLAGYWGANRLATFGTRRISGLVLVAAITIAINSSVGVLERGASHINNPFRYEALGVAWSLFLLVGPSFLALSMCAPTIQDLFARAHHREPVNPFFLYAASNLGSLLSLLLYPVIIEPNFTLAQQAKLFQGGLAALLILLLGIVMATGRRLPKHEQVQTEPVSWRERITWLALAAVPSSLMLGLTSFATTNVAPVPLFWVVPLGVYLLTFVVAFSEGNKVPSTLWARILPMLAVPLTLVMILESSEPIGVILLIHGAAFAVAALMCHTRLSETRPPAGSLTEFYLWLAIGGAVGGLFNAIIAPTVFSTLAEYPIAMVAALMLRSAAAKLEIKKDLLIGIGMLVFTAALALIAKGLEMPATPVRTVVVIGVPVVVAFFFSHYAYRFASAIGAVFLATHLTQVGTNSRILFADRSFFGVHRVLASKPERFHLLAHGTTLHGIQDRVNPARPLTYYTTNGPIGEVFAAYRKDNVALVGLGVGSCAAYGEEGKRMTFFEIDPLVVKIARDEKLFTFLRDSKANVDIVLGDARLKLNEQPNGAFGLLIVDAFSSDSIPMHLLTREAMQLYLDKTQSGGIIAMHISNRMLDLEPIVAKVAQDLGLVPLALEAAPNERQHAEGMRPSIWMVIVRDRADAAKLIGWRPAEPKPETPLWTDDYSNILSAWSAD